MAVNNIQGGQSLGGGLRVAGRAAAGRGLTIEAQAEQTAASGGRVKKGGVSENFKNALIERIERYQNSGRAGNSGQGDAQALADSISQAVAEVKNVYGQQAANSVMANVLKGVDEKGFSLESLTSSFSSAVRDVSQTGSSHQLQEISEVFNQDLAASADDPAAKEVKSFSRAVNDFFGLESREGKAKDTAVVAGFTEDGRWGEVTVNTDESAPMFIKGTEEAARLALESSASFSRHQVGEDTVEDLVNFLRHDLGSEEAAAYLENSSKHSDFMATMDQVISLALRDANESGDVAKLERYLNDQVKTAVNAVVSTDGNQFGYVEFQGWTFDKADTAQSGSDGAPGQSAASFESTWRYTNRDDVTYARGGQAKAKADAPEEEETGENDSYLKQLMKKMTALAKEKTGELIDEEV